MSKEHEIPESVIKQWAKSCSCCSQCSTVPCDSVCAGGVCDDLCDCDEDSQSYEDNEDYFLDNHHDENDLD